MVSLDTIVPNNFEEIIGTISGITLADIPHAGSQIAAHHPFCTLIVESLTSERCVNTLKDVLLELTQKCGWEGSFAETLCQKVSAQIEND